MDSEFDKDIDVILRRSRKAVLAGDASFENGAHPDADQFAAFAENSIPGASRAMMISHFADCARCRSVLSNLMLMSEAEETAPALVVEPVTEPWYRRLFVFPQIAFSMGALVLIFSAFFVYIAFRGLESGNDVSSVTEPTFDRPANSSKPANIEIPAANSSSNRAVSNTASAATPMPTAIDRRLDDEAVRNESTSNTSVGPDLAGRKDEKATESREALKTDAPAGGNTRSAPVLEQPTAGAATEEKVRDADVLADKNKAETNELRTRSAPSVPSPKKAPVADSRQIGSRTFTKRDGVWVDSQYGSQPLTVVRRGSDDFNKLDPEVRSIADRLSGPVIVVTNGRAVRIN